LSTASFFLSTVFISLFLLSLKILW
jgi:hypothetical protein